jgi:hypothetical protein
LAWPEEATFALSLEMKLRLAVAAQTPAFAIRVKKSAAPDRSEAAENRPRVRF